jgi:hypothetical protein
MSASSFKFALRLPSQSENELGAGSGDAARVFQLGRPGGASVLTWEGNAVKCDVCGTEVANSEEMKAHMEREHPLDERDKDEELESPDFAEDQANMAPIVPGKN